MYLFFWPLCSGGAHVSKSPVLQWYGDEAEPMEQGQGTGRIARAYFIRVHVVM